jgi:TetR/AcrR family transcriptional regulator, cholesterol catabolism regulator
MRDLAKATGRALASFYHLFGSKEEILFELQQRAFQRLLASATAVTEAPGTDVERLERFIANHVHYFVAEPAVMRVLVQEASTLPPQGRSVIRALKQRYFEIGEALVAGIATLSGAEPLTKLEIERSAYCMFGMLNWIYGWYEPVRHGTPDELARTIFDMTVSGIAGRAAREPAHLTLVRSPHHDRRGRP